MRFFLGHRILMTFVLISHFLISSFSQSQNWRDTLNVLNKQIAQSHWSTDLHLRKANANLQLKQWQYAVEEYALVLQHEACNPAALFYRAYAYTHLRRFDLARNDLSDLLMVLPQHFEARLSLAVVLQQLGRKQAPYGEEFPNLKYPLPLTFWCNLST